MSAHLAKLLGERSSHHERSLTAGVVIGVVTNNVDDEGLFRVRVKFPWLSEITESFWARMATPMAGPDRGLYFLPEIDDEVLVMFAHGDVRFPYVIGSLWNGKDKAPVADNEGNHVRMIKSRSGHVIKLNDKGGEETIEIIDGSGKNHIVIDTANNSVKISAEGDIELSAPNGKIKLAAQTIDIAASDDSKVVGKSMTVKATETLTVQGQPVNIN